jgi:hypothetical protein
MAAQVAAIRQELAAQGEGVTIDELEQVVDARLGEAPG